MPVFRVFFFFNDTATTEIYTLSLHDALPICQLLRQRIEQTDQRGRKKSEQHASGCEHRHAEARSEEHTSELQSPCNLVCRLLLEKKKQPRDRNLQCSNDRVPTVSSTSRSRST